MQALQFCLQLKLGLSNTSGCLLKAMYCHLLHLLDAPTTVQQAVYHVGHVNPMSLLYVFV